MRPPDFDAMTIAELRVYCAYIHTIGLESHKIISQLTTAFGTLNGTKKLQYNQLVKNAENVKGKLEVLGLTHPSLIK